MRRKPHSPRLYTLHSTLYTKKTEHMKKSYIAPQTEAIELLGANAIMAGSSYLNPTNGTYGPSGGGGIPR